MRWRFPDPSDHEEAQARDAIISQIDRWWGAFRQITGRLSDTFSRRDQFDIASFIHQHLNVIDERICWEFGPARRTEGHRLVITCEHHRELQPLIATIVTRAPRLPGWEFYEYRLAEQLDMAITTVGARRGREEAAKAFQVKVTAGRGNLIELQFQSPLVQGEQDAQAMNEAFVLAESLLGEEVLDRWIGLITTTPVAKQKLFGIFGGKRNAAGLIEVAQLAPTVLSLIDAKQSQLPDRPYYGMLKAAGEQQKWSALELKPVEAEEYASRDDLFVAITAFPDLFMGLNGPNPSDVRFSRCGETFCYLKLDGREGLEQTPFADRGEIEDAITAALEPLKIGGIFGGGTGRIYSYIDLALTDIDAAIPVIRDVLRRGNLPKRSWLLFFDAELADEWIGIYDDTPPPPK